MLAREPEKQVDVERLGEARVRNRGREPQRGQFVRRLQALAEPRAVGEERDLVALAHDAALADFERPPFRGQRQAHALAARITQRRRAVIIGGLGRDHVDELHLVRRRHQHEPGQAAEIGDVERAGMGRAVGADQPGAIHGEANRQLLQRDVMHHLVIGALQEGGIDRDERLVAFRGQAGGEGHRMLLGNADIETAIGELRGEQVEPGPRRHGGGDGQNLFVLARLLDEAFAEHLGVGGRLRLRLDLRAGRHVELDDAVIFVRRRLGGGIALALLGDDVQQDRTLAIGVAHVPQHREEVVQVVPVDRTRIIEAELLEQRAAMSDHVAGEFLGANRLLVDAARQALRDLAADFAQGHIGTSGQQPREIGRQGPDRRRYRHIVVVEDDDEIGIHRAGIVHRLVGHTGGHRPVADHAHDMVRASFEIARHRHAEPGRDGG